MSRDGSRRRVLSYDERVLWSTITKSVAPLREGAMPADAEPIAETLAEAASPKPARAPKSAKSVKPAAPVAPASKPSPPPLAPLGRRMARRVARGHDAIDARLDLHGLTQGEAHAALLRFLRAATARDARLVLVITGKGTRDWSGRGDGERGVLKRQVPHWLALPEFRTLVVGFEDAHIGHGGEGALYVRLRRARGE